MNYSSFVFIPQNYTYISSCLIIIFSLLCLILVKIYITNKTIRLIIIIGIILRIIIIYIDNFIKIISFSGGDSKVFHLNGYYGLKNISYWKLPFIESVMVPIYKILGEPIPIVIVLINLFFYTGAMIILTKIFNLISPIDKKRQKLIFFIINFSIITALLNVSLLRETIMLFFTTLSLYNFLKYFYYKKNIFFIVSIISILISTYFHSGMVFILFGYLSNFIFNKKGKKKLLMLIIGIIFIIILINFIEQLPYFKGQDLEKLSKAKIEAAGSTYATEVNGIIEYIITSPIRLFYFLFSPTPNQFRGGKDILAFLFNSSIYIFFVYESIKNYKKLKKKLYKKEKILIQSLFTAFFITTYAYAMGTTTAGTALRHRDKILVLLLVLNYYIYSLMTKKKKRKVIKK